MSDQAPPAVAASVMADLELDDPNAGLPKMFKWSIWAIALFIGVFHLLNVAGIVVRSTQEIRIIHLMTMLVLLFLSFPTHKNASNSVLELSSRVILAVLSAGVSFYLLARWQPIAQSGGDTVSLDAWAGALILLLVLEGARRGIGLILSGLCLLFLTYPFYSELLPGIFYSRGYPVHRVSEILTTTSEGLFGIPLGVSASYIILFCIYGAFLSAFGAGDFFFNLANRITKNARAAGAKSAVIFSTLLGMISGSAAGNVAVTGSLTIPMMKKEGYKPHQAGAIEAVVSTGGQIMPPVMGAAAFIMAEIIGVPYSDVMKAALIPAILFFVALFFVVHLQATKNNILPGVADENPEPLGKLLIDGGQYLIPFGILIGLMITGTSPFKATFVSIITLVITHVIWTRQIGPELLKKISRAIVEGSKSVIPIAIACAAAGIIAGILGITGLGSKISGLIISASGGVMFIALLFTMVTAIILGMGLPTTAAYLILATVVAPALSLLGLPPLTAHMFVFFYGCVSTITPPVALASYVAAGIARADINQVGFTAFAYGLTAYVLPFMFVFGPALLMDGSAAEIVLATLSGAMGAACMAAFVVGYGRSALTWPLRIMLVAASLALLHQGLLTDLVGLAIAAAVMFIQKPQAKPPETTKIKTNA